MRAATIKFSIALVIMFLVVTTSAFTLIGPHRPLFPYPPPRSDFEAYVQGYFEGYRFSYVWGGAGPMRESIDQRFNAEFQRGLDRGMSDGFNDKEEKWRIEREKLEKAKPPTEKSWHPPLLPGADTESTNRTNEINFIFDFGVSK